MRVIGYDPGATIGMAVLDVDGHRARLVDARVSRDTSCVEGDLTLWAPDLVAVETVSHVYPRARFSARMASAISNASLVAGRILGAAEGLGIPTVEVTAATWRKAIVGSGTASDARVKAAILGRIAGVPRCSAHVRDAAGVALFAALRKLRKDIPCHRQA